MNKNDNGSDTDMVGDLTARQHVSDAELLIDEDTAELPVLNPAAFADAKQVPGQSTADTAVGRAATWVRDVQGDVERLQKRWESLDRKLAEAHQRSATLQAKIEAKDTSLSERVAELETLQQRIEALEVTTAERDDTIAALKLTAGERDEALAAASRSLAEANSRAAVLEDRLQAAKHEVEELRSAMQGAKSLEAALRAEKDTVSTAQASLRARLHDLETYVDGRRDKWIDQQATLKNREAKISDLETALANSERRTADRDTTIESLKARILELERETSELEGRHLEREAAHQESQGLLHERIGEIERLRTRLEQGNDNAGNAELNALRASLADKDESIRRLEAELGKFEAVRAHIGEEQQVDRRTINVLQKELAQLQLQRDELATSLEGARATMDMLKEKLAAVERSSTELLEENDARKERISVLEAELKSREEVIAGFNDNAARLNQLSRNLNALENMSLQDERVPRVTGERQVQDLLEADVIFSGQDADEHTETKLDISDRDLERVHRAKRAADDSILADLGLSDRARKARRHAMVALSDVVRTVHAISKPVTTIGRSASSDIRIRDIVISRIHAQLRIEDGNLVVEDAGSKNGLAVNQETTERAVLKHGDVVALGTYEFRYLELEQATRTH